MVVFVGDKIKLGGLAEVIKIRLGGEIKYIEPNINIAKQENDILHIKDAKYIIYDTREYFDEGKEIIKVIKRIFRTNNAKPILLVPTDNPNNEIVKAAVSGQIKSIINANASLSTQKDQLEKSLTDFYEKNKDIREDLQKAKEKVNEDNKTLNEFVGELYDAKQREEEKENTIIINKKQQSEVIIDAFKSIFKTVFSIISIILMAVAIITLLYTDTRESLFAVLEGMYNDAMSML